ncbi:hypothetical protein LQD23_20165 [Chromobacterium violaceum]|uniref:hypothetical protein n=1 Tax=Chromobacterium violaceum TaxID=536 RepID=UPI001E35EBCD|nr:hypothetical protein [Chromobacterium violaceum]MCD0494596.1 hypothetical protein [Chromobacterium violaceum]
MTNKKARCFSVILRNGHGTYELTIPAQSKSDLGNMLNVPDNEKLISIKYLGFHSFSATPDPETDTVRFESSVGGKDICVAVGSLGYHHLRQLLADDVRAIDDCFNSDRDES